MPLGVDHFHFYQIEKKWLSHPFYRSWNDRKKFYAGCSDNPIVFLGIFLFVCVFFFWGLRALLFLNVPIVVHQSFKKYTFSGYYGCSRNAGEKFLSLGKGMRDLNGICWVQLIFTNTPAFLWWKISIEKVWEILKVKSECSSSLPNFDRLARIILEF